jgi:hypothetical protein
MMSHLQIQAALTLLYQYSLCLWFVRSKIKFIAEKIQLNFLSISSLETGVLRKN